MDQVSEGMARFVDVLPVAAAVLDRDLKFVAANSHYANSVHRSVDDMVGKNIFEIFPESDERRKTFEAGFNNALSGVRSTMAEQLYAITPLGGTADAPQEFYWTLHAAPIEDGGEIKYISVLLEDVTAKVRAVQLSGAIAAELQHRISNVLSVVSTIVKRTARGSIDIESFISTFEERINALSKTHAMLTGGNWDGMVLSALLGSHLEAYATKFGNRITFEGPTLRLSAAEAQPISMAIHELATNAVKYGALMHPEGILNVSWKNLPDNGFELIWLESNMSGVSAPTNLGFGTTILTRILPEQTNGIATQDYRPDGYHYSLRVEARNI